MSGEPAREKWQDLGLVLLLSLLVTGIFKALYYQAAPWIWGMNIPVNPEEITPWIRTSIDEHDGMEIYALYLLVFAILGSSVLLGGVAAKLGAGKRVLLGAAGVGALLFCAATGFIPPMHLFADSSPGQLVVQGLVIAAVSVAVFAPLLFLQHRFPRGATAYAALLLLPVCFLAISACGWRDYTYVFAPALRLLHGAAPGDIYFQYDLLPSLLAAAWMKLGLDLNHFRILGQAAYYAVLLGIYLLSRTLFRDEKLPVLLLAALILGRIYASPFDATLTFQTTPVRLDLWFLLLLAVYRLGPFHWGAGLVCGLLILLLKNFGIIYAAAYVQFLLALWGMGRLDGGKEPLMGSVRAFARRCAPPLAIIILCWIAGHFLFRNAEYGDYAGYYRRIGIGFIQIARSSFYWYVPTLFCAAAFLLLKLRRSLPEKYLHTGLLLLFCAIGNSLYFFGRSHEHNILNIAIVLLFLFFVVLDLAGRFLDGEEAASTSGRKGATVAAVALLAVIAVSYSGNIARKGYIQAANLASGKVTYASLTLPAGFEPYMEEIRTVTGGSRKVFFVDERDFAFYHYGGYEPVGYVNPFLTWIFVKDLKRYLQRLLDDGYYLVCSPELEFLLEDVAAGYRTTVRGTLVVGRMESSGGRQ